MHRNPQRPRGLKAVIRRLRRQDLQARQRQHGGTPGLGTLVRVSVGVRVRVRVRVRLRVGLGLRVRLGLSTFVEVERGEVATHRAVHEHLARRWLGVGAIVPTQLVARLGEGEG